MLDADDTKELRALQARAYGRDGALNAADAARLDELEARRIAAPDAQQPEDVGSAGHTSSLPEPGGLSDPTPARVTPAARVTTALPDTDPPLIAPAALRPALRRHWRAAALACAGLLVVGVGAGWALFGRDDDGIQLSSDEQQRSVELQSAGDYDPGSIEAIGRDDDAIVWFGTKKNGEMECIVLDVAGESSSGCQIAGEPERSHGLSAAVVDSSRSADGSGEQISATADRTHAGEMIALIRRWELGMDDWIHQFDPGEQDRAEALFDRGYEPFSLAVMGYAGGAPVWSATRNEGFTTQQCLIVDAVEATSCTDANNGMIPGEGIVIDGVTVDDRGGQTTPWAVTLDFTAMGRSYLVVTGEVPSDDETDADVDGGEITTGTITVRPGESLDVDEGVGDPLPVDVPPAGGG